MSFDSSNSINQVASGLAQAQLEAYNARDIEAFCACYSEDVEVLYFPGGAKILDGMIPFREHYSRMFNSCVDLHCLLLTRIVCGNFVFDEERVRRNAGEYEIEGVAI